MRETRAAAVSPLSRTVVLASLMPWHQACSNYCRLKMPSTVVDHFRDNLEALGESAHPALTERSESPAVEGWTDSSDVLRLRSASGRLVACHSRRDPQREAAQWLETAVGVPELPPLVLAVGLSCGFLLDEIDRRSDTTRVIALEPEPDAVRSLLSRRDWREWLRSGRLTLLIGPDYEGAGSAWRSLDRSSTDPPVIVHPVLARERPDDVAKAQRVARRIAFDARANREARQRLGSTYVLNTLANLQAIVQEGDVGALTNRFAGVPVVLVGAGPSLDHNLEELAELGDRALVLAADTALRPLVAQGVRPHLVVAADPSEENGHHLSAVEDVEQVWLVAEGSIDPYSFGPFDGRTFTFRLSDHHPWPWLWSLGFDRGHLRSWGSVLTSALDLALKAGCNPIVFMGSDLAYTNGHPYCRDTSFERQLPRGVESDAALQALWRDMKEGFSRVTVPDIAGTPTETARHLLAFRDWIVEQTNANADRDFVNATGAGVLAGGRVTQATLTETLATFPQAVAVRDVLRDAHQTALTSLSERERILGATRAAPTTALTEEWAESTDGRVGPDQLKSAVRRWSDAVSGRRRKIEVSEPAWQSLSPRELEAFCESIGQLAARPASGEVASVAMVEDAALDGNFRDSVGVLYGPRPDDAVCDEPVERYVLKPENMVPDSGLGFRFRFATAAGRLFTYHPLYARLQLFEDEHPLAMPGSRHTDIRSLGHGRYSMWRGAIYFSSSDGVDPRQSGRAYHILVPRYVYALEQLPPASMEKLGL